MLTFEQKKELSVLSTAPGFLNEKKKNNFLKAMFRLFRFLY